MNSRRLHDASLNYVSYGDEVLVDIGELETFFVVEVPLAGKGTIDCGTERTEVALQRASVVSPTEALTQRLSADFAQVILRLERLTLEQTLTEMIDRPLSAPLRFVPGMDITRGPGHSWCNLLSYCIRDADHGNPLLDNAMIAKQVAQFLMTELLLAQPHNYSDRLDGEALLAPSRVVDVAVDLMESRPEWPHTLASIASAAGVNTRTLQRAFQHHLNTSPTRYLRNLRLQRVRDELLATHPGLTSVGEISNRWGFFHYGQFAYWYQQKFGEAPSQTLLRHH